MASNIPEPAAQASMGPEQSSEKTVERPPDAELLIGLAGPIGTDLAAVVDALEVQLKYFKYRTIRIKLSSFLRGLDWEQPIPDDDAHPDARAWLLMDAGTELRQRWGRGDALALLGISAVTEQRFRLAEQAGVPLDEDGEAPSSGRTAYVFNSLKHPAEVATLRSVYGPRFFLIGAYSPPAARRELLREGIADSRGDRNEAVWDHAPDELMKRDESEGDRLGQRVQDTFHQADLFVDATDRDPLRKDLARLLEIVFGDPFKTATRDEFGLFQAAGASRRSSEPGRQVGAALAKGGSILSIGTNEVPAPGGGEYWDGDNPDQREFQRSTEKESNAEQQQKIALEIVDAIHESLDPKITAQEPAKLLQAVLGTRLGDLTEFGRAVHAEMSALLDAARRGVPVHGATLYSTTFPCHNCARHIIAAGITRVVYVAPYPKSLASDLHSDGGVFDGEAVTDPDDRRTAFVPFVGVAPRRYLELFDAQWRASRWPDYVRRKEDDGTLNRLDKRTAVPVFADHQPVELRLSRPLFRVRETKASALLKEVSGNGPKIARDGGGASSPGQP